MKTVHPPPPKKKKKRYSCGFKFLTSCLYSSKMCFHNQRCTAHDERQNLIKGSKSGRPNIIILHTMGKLGNLMADQTTNSVQRK